MIKNLVRHALPCALLAAALFTTTAQAEPMKAKLVLPAVSILFSPVYIAQDAGYFKDAGIDIDLGLLAGPAALNALIGGSAEFTSISGLIQLRAAQRGQKTLAIGGLQEVATSEVVLSAAVAERLASAKTAVERVKALKGLTLAVDAANGVPHSYLRYLGRQSGIDIDHDVRLVFVAPPAMNAALQRHEVDGFVFSSPFTLEAVQRGAKLWVSGPGGDFPELTPTTYNVLIARNGYCDTSPQACRAVIAGLERSLQLIKSEPKQALAILSKRFEKMDPALMREAFDSFQRFTPEQPMPMAKAFDHTIETMYTDKDDKDALRKLARTLYTDKFVTAKN